MIAFIILFTCITLDAFVYMMERGATTRNVNMRFCAIHSLIFASINTGIYLLANRVSYLVFSKTILMVFHQRISLIVLIGIALLILIKTMKRKRFEEKLNFDFNYKTSAKRALITSIDTFLIGINASMLSASFFLQTGLCFMITFGMIYTALQIGYNRGAAYQRTIGYSAVAVYLFMAALQALQIYSMI